MVYIHNLWVISREKCHLASQSCPPPLPLPRSVLPKSGWKPFVPIAKYSYIQKCMCAKVHLDWPSQPMKRGLLEANQNEKVESLTIGVIDKIAEMKNVKSRNMASHNSDSPYMDRKKF